MRNRILKDMLKNEFTTLYDVQECFKVCKSQEDVDAVLEQVPTLFGEWYIDYDDEAQKFTVAHTYFDRIDGIVQAEYVYEYPSDWEDTEDDN